MIPIPEKLVPTFIKQNPRLRRAMAALLLGLLIAAAYYFFVQVSNNMHKGRNLSDLRVLITNELLDSVSLGLKRFSDVHKRFPQTSGKYFFDSVKVYVTVPDVYVYADSTTPDGTVIAVQKRAGKKFQYKDIPNTYIGVGTPRQILVYKLLSPASYVLYSVGENSLDENGQGDDIVYKP